MEGERGLAAAVVLLVAAGLAHWVFLAVAGAVLAVAFVLAFPSSLRARREGAGIVETEAGLLAATALSVAALMAVTIAGFLRAPFQTFEIKEDPRRYRPKLANDLRALFLPALGPVAAGGAAVLGLSDRVEPPKKRRARYGPRPARRFVLRLLVAWTVVSLAGVAYGAVTLNLPPHRFLALLVAVPLAITLAGTVRWIATWLWREGSGRMAGLAAAIVTIVALGALSVPGAVRWYQRGPGEWIGATGLRQALTASGYLSSLPVGRPVIFVIDQKGAAGVLSAALKERTIRVGVPPERQADVHVYVGEPSNLLAGRPTPFRGALVQEATAPYWEDVSAVLPQRPPILILSAFADREYQEAVAGGAGVIGDGVAVLRGVTPSEQLPEARLPPAVPRTRSALPLAAAMLVLLGIAGAGWSRVLFGTGLPPEAFAGLVPVVGAAALMIGGLVPARLGVGVGGANGVAVYVVVAVAGALVASMRPAKRR
jgi:hypothetical protein